MTLDRRSRSMRAGMAVLSGAAALMVALPAVAAPDACSLIAAGHRVDPVRVPFRTIDGRIYVDVLVNGRGPYVFALDTGASGMGRADASLVAALGLAPVGKGQASDGIKQAEVDLVKIRSLKFGNLERRDLEIIARDYRSRLSPEAAFAACVTSASSSPARPGNCESSSKTNPVSGLIAFIFGSISVRMKCSNSANSALAFWRAGGRYQ